jgi:hypothetical protein
LSPVHRSKGIYIDHQWYNVNSLAQMIKHNKSLDHLRNQPAVSRVPHTRKPFTNNQRNEISRRGTVANYKQNNGPTKRAIARLPRMPPLTFGPPRRRLTNGQIVRNNWGSGIRLNRISPQRAEQMRTALLARPTSYNQNY